MSDVSSSPRLRGPVFVLSIWATMDACWSPFIIDPRRELLEGVAARLVMCVPVPVCIVEAALDDDDVIEAVLMKLPAPGGLRGAAAAMLEVAAMDRDIDDLMLDANRLRVPS